VAARNDNRCGVIELRGFLKVIRALRRVKDATPLVDDHERRTPFANQILDFTKHQAIVRAAPSSGCDFVLHECG
jgi:hypothetical protein